MKKGRREPNQNSTSFGITFFSILKSLFSAFSFIRYQLVDDIFRWFHFPSIDQEKTENGQKTFSIHQNSFGFVSLKIQETFISVSLFCWKTCSCKRHGQFNTLLLRRPEQNPITQKRRRQKNGANQKKARRNVWIRGGSFSHLHTIKNARCFCAHSCLNQFHQRKAHFANVTVQR